MIRIIDKQTGMFLRDDFSYNEETEIGLEVVPAQGFYHPKWENGQWVEGLTSEEITAIKSQPSDDIQPTLEEKVTELQNVITELTTILNDKGIAP